MASLVSKLSCASLDVGGKLSADKTNQEQRYDYLSADKILSVGGQALANQGVMVIPQVDDSAVNLYEYTDSYGKTKKRYDCTVHFTFTISDGETTIQSPWVGMGSDYTVPDKATYKAITSGHKYFLMKLLCIGAGNEDGEHEGEDVPVITRQPVTLQQAPRQAAPRPTPAKTNGNGKQQEAAIVAEPPAPPEEPPADNEPVADWPAATISAIVEKYQTSPYHARNLIKLSNLPVDSTPGACMTWIETYKAYKASGLTTVEAAEKANS